MMVNFSLQWHITQKCGNRCRHCYMDDTSYDLTFEDYTKCIENIRSFEESHDFCVNSIAITGGDPLLNKDWFRIAQDIVARGKSFMLLGNPELLTEETLEKISSLSPRRYQLSLDGMPEKHDYIRYRGSFEKTIEGIRKLHRYHIPVAIMFTLSNENADDLFEVIRYLDSLKIKLSFAFDFVIETGHAKTNQIHTPVDKQQIFAEYIKLKQELQAKDSLLTLHEKPSQMFAYKNQDFVTEEALRRIPFDICSGCGAGWKHLTIIKKGDVLACRRMPVQVGNLLTDSFEDILLHAPVLQELRKTDALGECSSCAFLKFCRGCPAEKYAQAGTFFNQEQKCRWYRPTEPPKPKPKSEWEKLSNTAAPLKMLGGAKKEIIKAWIILSKRNECKQFLADPETWQQKHHLQLAEKDIGNLIFLVFSQNLFHT